MRVHVVCPTVGSINTTPTRGLISNVRVPLLGLGVYLVEKLSFDNRPACVVPCTTYGMNCMVFARRDAALFAATAEVD